MVQIQLINNIIEWQRGLEIKAARQKHQESGLFVNYLAAPQACWKERAHEGQMPAGMEYELVTMKRMSEDE